MPIRFDGGLDEANDSTDLAPGRLAEARGEYRVGDNGFWSPPGRLEAGSLDATIEGLYYAGFDDDDVLLAQSGGTIYSASIEAGSASFASLASAGSAALPPVGVHYGGRHNVVNGATNLVVTSATASRKMGMIAGTVAGTAIPSGSGSMTTVTGCEYWATEYDATNGIESIAGATFHSGSFTSAAGVSLTLTGVSRNSNSTHWRIYRSTDGGVFPDGGLLTTLAIGTTSYQDTDIATDSDILPAYGSIDINGLDFDRDEMPGVLYAIGGPFEGSLVGFDASDRHEVRYTPSGYPESWPSIFAIPLQTERHDEGVGFSLLNGQIGVFTRDTVHRITRLPREVDSVFAAGEAISLVTDERGAISRRGIAKFTLPGRGQLIGFVARDGIWATNLAPNTQIPLTDPLDWLGRVDAEALSDSVLVNNPLARRLEFYYRRAGESYNAGVLYLDYQGESVRLTTPDHGPLADGVLAPYGGLLRVWSADSRADNGGVYIEGAKGSDDSELLDASGSIAGSLETPYLFPGGPQDVRQVGTVSYMHSAGPAKVDHEVFYDRVTEPEARSYDWSEAGLDDLPVERHVNGLSLRLYWTTTTPFRISWAEVEGLESSPLHGEGK